jgi:cysteine rich repeat protein
MQKSIVIACAAFVVVAIAPLSAIAYTQADASACTSDAMRLCQKAIPDEGRVSECLYQHKRQLSPPCSVVFKRPRETIASRDRGSKRHKTKF